MISFLSTVLGAIFGMYSFTLLVIEAAYKFPLTRLFASRVHRKYKDMTDDKK